MRILVRMGVVGLAVTALAVGLAGCFNPFSPRIAVTEAVSEAQPSALGPTGVIDLFRWCYEHRDINVYKGLFSADYVFTFSQLDPAGDPYRGTPWRREDELASTTHLFVTGNATEEPASSISLTFDATLIPQNDPRQGASPNRWHKLVTTGVVLDVQRSSGSLQVKGRANFFVVRGDSALIPPELNLRPDSLRWYIQGWVDDTASPNGAPGARARPAHEAGPALNLPSGPYTVSFGGLKTLYRSP